MKYLKILVIIGLFVGSLLSLTSLNSPKVSAANASNWNAGNIISDSVFYDTAAMNSGDIQNFLNAKVPTCDTNGSQIYSGSETRAQYGASKGYPPPYTCLKSYTQSIPSVGADSYCSQGVNGGTFTAAQIISMVSQACGINPEVLIVLLQKEQGLVTDDWPWSVEYTDATGYGCPDTAACDPSFAGFFNQVYNAAHQFRRYILQSQNFNYVAGNTSFISYQANNSGCGGTNVFLQNGATAALYNYTPYQPNAAALANLYGSGDGCSAYGNRNFWRDFTDWFGSTETTIPYAWAIDAVQIFSDSAMTQAFSADTTVAPGGHVYVKVLATNTGNQTWNQGQLNLGTFRPMQRTSQFYDSSWFNTYRPATISQSSVLPGDVATFQFKLTALSNAGQYQEYFNLVAENITWLNDLGLNIIVNVVAPISQPSQPSGSQNSLSAGQTLIPGNYLISPDGESTFTLQTDGNLVQYDNYRPVWNSVTFGKTPQFMELGFDGNLVVFFTDGTIWQTGTTGHPNASLKIQSDGNLVLYDQNGSAYWNTVTFQTPTNLGYVSTHLNSGQYMLQGQELETADRHYRLVFQLDGNLVLYSNQSNRALWSSNTQLSGAKYLNLQNDGNLVIYNASGKPLWNSVTFGNGPSQLVIQQDGNVVLYNGARHASWNTVTFGQQ